MVGIKSLAVIALSLTPSLAAPAPLERRAISTDLLAKFNLYYQYAAAAYCPGNNDSPGTKLTCPAKNCPSVESADTFTLTEFKDTPVTDSTGYVAVVKSLSLIVVSFRGSKSVRNWLANINFPDADTGLCASCTAAGGFLQSWQEVKPQVIAAIRLAKTQNPTFQIITTGHSLGGAIATLAAAELRTLGLGDVALYSFGAPRVAGTALSAYISQQKGGNYRVTHTNDPVPKLPPLLASFVHISPEYYVKSGNNVAVTAADVSVYTGAVNLGGNTGNLSIDTAAHSWYFGPIAACSPDGFELRKRDMEELVRF